MTPVLALQDSYPPARPRPLDCTLPGGLGEDLITRGGSVPVILMSGNPEMADKSPRNRPFVLKPFALSASIKAVNASIGADIQGLNGANARFRAIAGLCHCRCLCHCR